MNSASAISRDTPADLIVATLDSGSDLANRDVVGSQLHGIDRDLILLDEPSNARDLGDAGTEVSSYFKNQSWMLLKSPRLSVFDRSA